MFRIKSDDQRAKTVKRIERFKNDLEQLTREKGKKAAASFRRTYQSHVGEFLQQLDNYDRLKREGVAPFHGSDLLKLGAYLVDARIASGITQKEIAKKLGVTQPMVFKYENAEYRGCNVEIIERVMEALGLNLDLDISQESTGKLRFQTRPVPHGIRSRWAGEAFFRDEILRDVHA